MDTTQLPDTTNAKLPGTYERAKEALAQCSQVDEVKDWADKAEALASYAKQANDDTLRKLADRIQARAIRRAGELLKQVDGRQGQNLPGSKSNGTDTFSRGQAAQQAGLSKRQTDTAVRVANVPEDDFEQQVESDDPPTVTNLAEQGKQKRQAVDLGGASPQHFARATELQGMLRRLAEYCDKHDPQDIAGAFKENEAPQVKRWIDQINQWTDRFFVSLPGGQDVSEN